MKKNKNKKKKNTGKAYSAEILDKILK